jgi:hypothetical protein
MNLLETILSSQDGALVRQLAGRLNLDEDKARAAVGALVPALGSGLSRNASSPQGLQDLLGALAGGDHGRYLEQPEKLTQPDAVAEGNGILGHIFGSKEVSRQVAARAAERTGVDTSVLKQMLPLLATAAMGALSRGGAAGAGQAQDAGGSAGGLGGMLGQMLDADKDGSVVDDLMGIAGRFLR